MIYRPLVIIQLRCHNTTNIVSGEESLGLKHPYLPLPADGSKKIDTL